MSGSPARPQISPLSLAQVYRETWGQFDPCAIAQLAPLASDPCYQLKIYKAPSDDLELLPADGFVSYGLRITPGSVIFGFYLPVVVDPGAALITWLPPQFTVQIRDEAMEHDIFDAPLSSLFLSNARLRYQSQTSLDMGSSPNLLTAPYPVTGSGLFSVDIQETSGSQQRIQLVFGVLEVCQ